jgi:hypothetical protein
MKTLILAGSLLVASSLAMPRAAAADVSVAIGLPGVGIFVGHEAPHYRRYYPTYWAPPVPVVVGHDHGRHRGWWRHGGRHGWRHGRHCD